MLVRPEGVAGERSPGVVCRFMADALGNGQVKNVLLDSCVQARSSLPQTVLRWSRRLSCLIAARLHR